MFKLLCLFFWGQLGFSHVYGCLWEMGQTNNGNSVNQFTYRTGHKKYKYTFLFPITQNLMKIKATMQPKKLIYNLTNKILCGNFLTRLPTISIFHPFGSFTGNPINHLISTRNQTESLIPIEQRSNLIPLSYIKFYVSLI